MFRPDRPGRKRWGLRLAACGLLAVGAAFLGNALYLDAKAVVAQVLLQRAWDEALASGAPAQPWPWADTRAVARLRLPDGGVDQIVLAGANGRNLAFGPTKLDLDPLAGLTVLSGHRDTHFAFLQSLAPGNVVEMQGLDGDWRRYRISAMEVMDSANAVIPARPASAPQGLVLVTCWPFDAVDPGTPWRYVVSALPEDAAPDG
jgi:sortase A